MKTLLLCIAIIYCGSFSAASACLWSRLEHYPCTYRHATTGTPGSNEQGEYRTTCSNYCEILMRKHKVQAIPQVSSSYGSIFCLFSPGKLYYQPKNYINRNLVYYNVNCSSGQHIYFQMIEMDIESSTCYDATVDRDKCVDYIQVNTAHGHNITDNCGTDTSNLDGEIFPFDSIQVIFRSNCAVTRPGFYATAMCYTPQQAMSRSATTRCSARPVDRPTSNECKDKSHDKIEIPYGHKASVEASAESTSIKIINLQNNHVIRRLRKSSIATLSFRAMNGTVQRFENNYIRVPPAPSHTIGPPHQIRYGQERLRLSRSTIRSDFYRSRRVPRIPSELKGPGILFLPKSTASSHACFQNYLVDVSDYIPSRKEKEIIKTIHSALKTLVDKEELLDESDDDDNDGEQSESTSEKSRHLQLQKRSVSTRRTGFISQDVLLSAVQNEEACNPILRSSSAALTNALKKEDPVEYRKLKQTALRLAHE